MNFFFVHTEARSKMTQYWRSHSHEASEAEMMLDSNAKQLGEKEIPEILAHLGETTGKDILEVGAGIGLVYIRFTHSNCSIISGNFLDGRLQNVQGYLTLGKLALC